MISSKNSSGAPAPEGHRVLAQGNALGKVTLLKISRPGGAVQGPFRA